MYYQDERLTTVTAEHALLEDNMHRAERRQNVDKVAAAIILQQYLDSQVQNTTPTGHESEENTMTMDNESNIIELIDDETGATVPFEHLATIEHEGEYYIALMLIEEDANDEEGEVVIMKIEADDEGNECYVCVEDEDLQETVFEKFLQLMEEAEDEE